MNWTEEQYAEHMKKKGVEVEKPKRSKYHNVRTNGYDSKHEAAIAAELHLRAKAEKIKVFEQVPFGLTKDITYIADFVVLHPDGRYEVIDAKGMLTDVYKLKKKLMREMWGVEIQEV